MAVDFSGGCVRLYRLALKSNGIGSHLIWILWNTGNKAFYRRADVPIFNHHATNRLDELSDLADWFKQHDEKAE